MRGSPSWCRRPCVSSVPTRRRAPRLCAKGDRSAEYADGNQRKLSVMVASSVAPVILPLSTSAVMEPKHSNNGATVDHCDHTKGRVTALRGC
jgi:hypothetical protein